MLKAPRHDLARPVLAVETMTASTIESPSFGRELGEEWRRLPKRGIGVGNRGQLFHSADNVVQAERVGIEHRSATIQRKAVARQVDQVDVGRAKGNALLQDARAFIHECK